MKKEKRIPPQEGNVALATLAKLMPWLTAKRSLKEILRAINSALGSRLAWVMVEQNGVPQFASTGETPCTLTAAQHFIEQLPEHRRQRAWRVICWRRNVGNLLFPLQPTLASKLQTGILCKLKLQQANSSGYFFIAFKDPLISLEIMKNVVVILVEKLKHYLGEIIVRDRAAKELQRIITQYKALFDRAPVLMSSFDKNNHCVLWNGECERLFGWTLEELNQQPDPLALFYPDPDVRQRVRSSVTLSNHVDMQEWHPIRRDGQQLTVLWSNILLPDNSILSIGLDITERKKAEQQLTMEATIDELTGCYNRSSLLRQLKEALANCQPEVPGTHFSLLMLDLDHFKSINDRFGHQTGDAALVHFCQLVRQQIEESWIFGRLGGEEFLILMPQTDKHAALRFSQKLHALLLQTPLINAGKKVTLAFSAGLLFVTGKERDSSVLLTHADNALYEAKRGGRSKTVVASAFI